MMSILIFKQKSLKCINATIDFVLSATIPIYQKRELPVARHVYLAQMGQIHHHLTHALFDFKIYKGVAWHTTISDIYIYVGYLQMLSNDLRQNYGISLIS